MQGVLPIDRAQVPADMLAGMTLAALGIPEVLGYAKIAGMPVVTGLYTLLLPMAVFAVLGSSRHLVVAADSATAAILAAALTGLAAVGSERYVRLAGLAALLVGGMLLLARLARLGFAANFLSRTVLVGFLTGVGIQVAAGQLPDMLGVAATGKSTPAKLVDIARALPQVHGADVAVSAGVIVIVLAARWVGRRNPGPADRGDRRDHREPGGGSGEARRGRARTRPARAAAPPAAGSRLARRRRAAWRRGLDVRGHPRPERGDLARLRREV